MKTVNIWTICWAMLVTASAVIAAQTLTVNGQDVNSVTLYLDKTVTVEVVSDNSSAYSDLIGFDQCRSLGELTHIETKPEAGNFASVYEKTEPNFCGFQVIASSLMGSITPGVHFVFEYTPRRLGQDQIKLYDGMHTTLFDSVTFTIQPTTMTTAFTYQGRLIDYNLVADGAYDFQFGLYDAPTDSNQIGSDVNIAEVEVIDGYFTVMLDFGSDAFLGEDRWLQIGVRAGDLEDPNTYTLLNPRQQLTATPIASVAREAAYCENAVSGGGTVNTIAKFVTPEVIGDSVIHESAGKIGIGTDSPHGTLQLNDYDNQLVLVGTNAAANEKNWVLGADQYGLTLSAVTDSFSGWAGILHIERNTTAPERIIFPNPGKFGIGEAYPDATLTVSASGGADDLFMLSSNDNMDGDLFIVKNSGDVGIGTKTPARKLHVNDVIRLQPRTSAPSSPSEGDMYMDSTTHKLMVYDGSAWRACW